MIVVIIHDGLFKFPAGKPSDGSKGMIWFGFVVSRELIFESFLDEFPEELLVQFGMFVEIFVGCLQE